MAQNITLLGANYSNVPGVDLPKTGGGTARFTDVTPTTAAASDVAQGKVFFDASGTQTTGTASGGGGASNFVHGKFTTGSSSGPSSLTIPYSGAGYPVAAIVVVAGGMYDEDSTWYNLVNRYAIGEWTMTKAAMTLTPTHTSSGTQNYGVVTSTYKSSSSNATSYTRAGSLISNTYSIASTGGRASGTTTQCVRFQSSTTMSYYVKSTSYGLVPEFEYEYFIAYSE